MKFHQCIHKVLLTLTTWLDKKKKAKWTNFASSDMQQQKGLTAKSVGTCY